MVVFELRVANAPTWNGKFSGEGNYYAETVAIRDKNKVKEIVEKGTYHYRWDDGWSVNIKAFEVDSKDAAKIRRRSKGFMGYDWMIDSIIEKGHISED